MFNKDWILRQIEMMTQMIAKIFFSKSVATEVLDESGSVNELWLLDNDIKDCVKSNQICRAEDMLFRYMETHPYRNIMLLAEEFYLELNEMTDEALQKNNFSRQEIAEGLIAISKFYGIEIAEENTEE